METPKPSASGSLACLVPPQILWAPETFKAHLSETVLERPLLGWLEETFRASFGEDLKPAPQTDTFRVWTLPLSLAPLPASVSLLWA